MGEASRSIPEFCCWTIGAFIMFIIGGGGGGGGGNSPPAIEMGGGGGGGSPNPVVVDGYCCSGDTGVLTTVGV